MLPSPLQSVLINTADAPSKNSRGARDGGLYHHLFITVKVNLHIRANGNNFLFDSVFRQSVFAAAPAILAHAT